MKTSVIVNFLAFAIEAFAHGGVYSYDIDGVTYNGYKWFEPPDNQTDLIQRRWHMWPVEDPNSSNLTCNFNGEALSGSFHAPIKAGSTITAHWSNNYTWSDPNQWFYCDPVDLQRPCPPNIPCVRECLYTHWYHAYGPMLAYMADCGGDCSKANAAELKWFKIGEQGLRPGYTLNEGAGWPQGDMSGPAGKPKPGWTLTIPKSLKPGNYMIRHELIMLELMPPQFYPDCAQLTVEGDGTAFPSEEYLVKFPGAYKMTDPGLAIAGTFYSPPARNTTNYTIPGPKVWTG